jgi:hypothetical protein
MLKVTDRQFSLYPKSVCRQLRSRIIAIRFKALYGERFNFHHTNDWQNQKLDNYQWNPALTVTSMFQSLTLVCQRIGEILFFEFNAYCEGETSNCSLKHLVK